MNSLDFSKIKLVIWDLDNTFWKGIISETAIEPIDSHLQLVKDLVDCGIVNSICSKNNFEICDTKLIELQIREYFVFPSIDWSPKGLRVKDLIKSMSLRAENVLFIDDDLTNLAEVQYYSPSIMVAEPLIIVELIEYVTALDKTDLQHKRLNQYKLLEIKYVEQQKFNSNEEFLFASRINVSIKNDCINQFDRIHDLLLRSNQLNFTKIRPSKEELLRTLHDDNIQSGYVEVKDKFGDYGIVGFYSLKDYSLLHFTFSCRTIGLGVESFVYAALNWPELTTVGEVVNTVDQNPAPKWINHPDSNDLEVLEKNTLNKGIKVLVKGPCDLSKTMNYIKNSDSFVCEFTYVNEDKNNTIEAHNHSVHIVGLKQYSDEEKNILANECIFIDRKMLDGTIFSSKYDVIFLSTLIEANFGIYRKKGTDLKIAFGSYLSPITDPANWNDYIQQKIFTANNNFSEDFLQSFGAKYEFIGKTTPDDYIQRLDYILENTHQNTIICLILGVEFPCEKQMEYDYKERHRSHIELNNAIREFAQNNKRIRLIDLNDIVKSQSDFTNNINHFTSKVYYELSLKVTEIINSITDANIVNYGSYYQYLDIGLNWIKDFLRKIVPQNTNLYSLLKRSYKKFARSKK